MEADINSTLAYLRDLTDRVALHNYGVLLDDEHRIITFGDDDRGSAGFKDEFIRSLPQLRDAGIDTVAFEDMPIYMQATIDHYFSLRKMLPGSTETQAARKELLDHLESFWNASDLVNSRTLEIVDAIADVGMKMLAIEPDLPAMHKYADENGKNAGGLGLLMQLLKLTPASMQEIWTDFYNADDPKPARLKIISFLQAEWRRSDSATGLKLPGDDYNLLERFMDVLDTSKSAGLNLSGLRLPIPCDPAEVRQRIAAGEPELFVLSVNWRNQTWKQRIIKAFEDGSTGVAVLAGACHFNDELSITLNEMLERDGYASVAVTLAGAELNMDGLKQVEEASSDYGLPPIIHFLEQEALLESTANLNLKKERFALRMPERRPHWLVHLPETDQRPLD
jgi:hypothetical protein